MDIIMKRLLFAFASMLAVAVGCTVEEKTSEKADAILYATIDDTCTKATLNYGGSTASNYQIWETGDKILLLQGDNVTRIEATLASGAGGKTAKFSANSVPTGDFFAIYPVHKDNCLRFDYGDDSLKVVFPSHLTYNSSKGKVEGGSNVMVAKASGDEIHFQNFCSYLHFNITGNENQKVKKIEISAFGYDLFAGRMYSEIDGSNLFYGCGFDDYYSQSKSFDITFPNPEALSAEGLSLVVPVAPCCEYGFKMTITLENGDVMTKQSETTWERNEVINFPSLAFVADPS